MSSAYRGRNQHMCVSKSTLKWIGAMHNGPLYQPGWNPLAICQSCPFTNMQTGSPSEPPLPPPPIQPPLHHHRPSNTQPPTHTAQLGRLEGSESMGLGGCCGWGWRKSLGLPDNLPSLFVYPKTASPQQTTELQRVLSGPSGTECPASLSHKQTETDLLITLACA